MEWGEEGKGRNYASRAVPTELCDSLQTSALCRRVWHRHQAALNRRQCAIVIMLLLALFLLLLLMLFYLAKPHPALFALTMSDYNEPSSENLNKLWEERKIKRKWARQLFVVAAVVGVVVALVKLLPQILLHFGWACDPPCALNKLIFLLLLLHLLLLLVGHAHWACIVISISLFIFILFPFSLSTLFTRQGQAL